jgi:hypothetical protein
LNPKTVTHVIQQPSPCYAPREAHDLTLSTLLSKKGRHSLPSFLEGANVGAFQASGVASTQDEIPLTSFNGCSPISFIWLSIISHGLKIRERPHLFYWYLQGRGLLCRLVVETTIQVTSDIDTNGKGNLSLNVVPGVSISRRRSRRTPVKVHPYSRCPCII